MPHYFVTGASGFIGFTICKELVAAGHKVVGLARSDEAEKKLKEARVEPVRGTLEDVELLAKAAKESDGVVHCGFIHDFSKMADSGAIDNKAITAMGEALVGSNKPLVISSGALLVKRKPGQVATEDDVGDNSGWASYRVISESIVLAFNKRGVRGSVMRLPPTVHGDGDHGFIPFIITCARTKGVSAYPGDGKNVWPAVHVKDAAHAYVLALEKGTGVYHVNDEQGVPTKEIAAVIGNKLNLNVASVSGDDVKAHFNWIAGFFSIDAPTSSAKAREQLGWKPSHATLLADLEHGTYFSLHQDTTFGTK